MKALTNVQKTIILNGNPRRKGSASALTDAFRKGAEEAGLEVLGSHLAQMKINGCIGCRRGGKGPEHPYPQKDDTEQIYPPTGMPASVRWM